MTEYSIVLLTVPDEELAVKVSRLLVEKKLAACVNIVPQIRSIYLWENEICDEKEFLLYIKTKKKLFSSLQEEILKIHSYSVPEIIELEINNGFEKYLKWLENSTQNT